MSKSKGNILDPLEIIKKYGVDSLRYYLIKEVSFGNDGNISEEKLENCINSDLANNFGNLCQRVISFNEKNINLKIPQSFKFNKEDLQILNNYKNNFDNLIDFIDNQKINEYVNFIQDQLFAANKYFNDQEPWKKKADQERLNTIVYVSLELIRKISILLYPIIPTTTLKVLNKFTQNLPSLRDEIDNLNINFYINFIINALFDANKYFNDQEPWKKKENKERLEKIVYTSLEMIRKISFMLYPIIPDSIKKALTIFNISTDDIDFESIGSHNYLKAGDNIKKIEILFKKVEIQND